MATTRAEIIAFLPGDLDTVVPSAFGVASGDIYFVNSQRERSERTEIQLSWAGRARDPGCSEDELRVYSVIIQLYRKLRDSYAKEDFQRELEAAAEAITAAYNNNPDRFQGDITSPIDFVECQEIDGGPNWQRHKAGVTIIQRLQLNIGTHEAPRS